MSSFQEGQRAFKTGNLDKNNRMKGNPYSPDTQDYKRWELGFNKAYFKNLRKVQRHEKT